MKDQYEYNDYYGKSEKYEDWKYIYKSSFSQFFKLLSPFKPIIP